MTTNYSAFQDYLQFEKKYSSHTITAYGNDIACFESFIKTHFDQQNIDQVNYAQIRTWIVSLVEQGLAAVSVNRKVASLKSFYRFLLKTKQIQSNPLIKHNALKTPKIIQIPFSQQEVTAILNQLENTIGYEQIRNKLIIDLFYTTGMRRAELIGLTLQNIDLSNGLVKVLGKRNKERIIPILPIIIEQFQSYIQERQSLIIVEDVDYFFLTKRGTKLNESFVYRLINSYFSTVSQKVKKSPHILRHSFATHLLNNGADLNAVKELLGHSSLGSTQVYTHNSLSELKNIHKQAHPRGKK